MTARTAGFCTVDFSTLSNAGLLVIMLLMFIGASPGSTGGGIKTTTFFVLMQQVRSIFSKRRLGAFHRRLPDAALPKAATITLMGIIVVLGGTFGLCILEPETDFVRLLFEQISATARQAFHRHHGGALRRQPGAADPYHVHRPCGRGDAALPLGRAPRAHRPLYRRSHYDWVNTKPQGNHRRGGFHIRPCPPAAGTAPRAHIECALHTLPPGAAQKGYTYV